MTNLHVSRSQDSPASLRKYKVILDDSVCGVLKQGESVTIPVLPGRHTFHASIDWARTQKISFEMDEGESKHIELAWGCTGAARLLVLVLSFFPGEYIRAHLVDE